MTIADTLPMSQLRPLHLYGVVDSAQALLFKKLDADQSGGLTLDELGSLGLGGGKNDPATVAVLDGDKDGQLSLGELQQSKLFSRDTLNTLLATQSQNGLADWFMGQGDADADGSLGLDEFRAVGPQGEWAPPQSETDDPLAQIEGKADRAFAAADTDGDGRLTSNELADFMAHDLVLGTLKIGAPLSASNLSDLDTDHSGGFSKAELAGAAPGTDVDMDALFGLVDKDGDGQLTTDELQAEIASRPDFYNNGLVVSRVFAVPPPPMPDNIQDLKAEDLTAWSDQVRAWSDQLRDGAASIDTPSAGQQALSRVLRANIGRLQDEMIAAARPQTSAIA